MTPGLSRADSVGGQLQTDAAREHIHPYAVDMCNTLASIADVAADHPSTRQLSCCGPDRVLALVVFNHLVLAIVRLLAD